MPVQENTRLEVFFVCHFVDDWLSDCAPTLIDALFSVVFKFCSRFVHYVFPFIETVDSHN